MSVTDEQLLCIERARGQEDVVFQLKLQLTLLEAAVDAHPVCHNEVQIRLNRARWIEMLDQAGTEVGVTIRVVTPLIDSGIGPFSNDSGEDTPSLAQATARLRQARDELRDHRWEQCVATCRKVLENVGHLADLPTQKSVSDVLPARRSQAQRWAAIYWDVRNLANAAHHDDEGTAKFVWARPDAEAILASTSGLLARYATR